MSYDGTYNIKLSMTVMSIPPLHVQGYIRISTKGHNSGILCPGLTQNVFVDWSCSSWKPHTRAFTVV